jgi:GT2 family glycosyltransferase
MGFSKANNRALSLSKGKYILFLNPDTIIPEECLTYCIRFFEKTADAGALGVQMINGKGKFLPESKRAFPSPCIAFFKLTGWPVLFPASGQFNRYALGSLDKEKNHEVDVLAGAFMMVKKEILLKAGGFDETFFMYGEDIDLSYRIQNAGYKNYYLGKICIIHFKGESTQKENNIYIILFYKAMSVFVHKYHTGKATVSGFPIQFAITLMSLFSFITWSVNKAVRWIIHTLVPTYRQLVKLNPIKKANTTRQLKQAMVLGSEKEYAQVKELLLSQEKQKYRLLRIEPATYADNPSPLIPFLCLISMLRIQKVIFCRTQLSYSMSIILTRSIPHCSFRFFDGNSLIGSDSARHQGKYLTKNRRND